MIPETDLEKVQTPSTISAPAESPAADTEAKPKDAIYDIIGGLEAMADTTTEEPPTSKTIDGNSQSTKISRAITYIILCYGIFFVIAATISFLFTGYQAVPGSVFSMGIVVYASVILRVGIILYQMHLERDLSENERIYVKLVLLSAIYTG